MRILHLLKTSVGATWAYRMVREHMAAGVDVHVALPGGGPKVAEFRALGATVHELQTDLPIRDPLRMPSTFLALRRLVDAVKPDLIHSHFVGTTLTMRLALADSRVPRIFQVPGPLHLEHAMTRNGELAVAGPADHWIATCRWIHDRYSRSGVPRERLHFAYYGTDLERLTPQPPGKLRRELGLDADTPIVGMVAYVYAPKRWLGATRGLKGHEDLIDAMALLRRTRPNVRCVIVGGAWQGAQREEARVREYAKRRCGDAVIFLGTRRDVPELYADFTMAVHPSHSENLGGSQESLPLGVPTIATRVGAFPDVVRDGETGWLVPPKDPPAIARAIEEVLDDPEEARRRTVRGQQLTRTLVDVRSTAKDTLGIYETILRAQR